MFYFYYIRIFCLKRDIFGGQIFPPGDKVKPTCPSIRHDGLRGVEVGIYKFLTCTVWRSVASFTHWPTILGVFVGLRAVLEWLEKIKATGLCWELIRNSSLSIPSPSEYTGRAARFLYVSRFKFYFLLNSLLMSEIIIIMCNCNF
jgi:hypothetical protein